MSLRNSFFFLAAIVVWFCLRKEFVPCRHAYRIYQRNDTPSAIGFTVLWKGSREGVAGSGLVWGDGGAVHGPCLFSLPLCVFRILPDEGRKVTKERLGTFSTSIRRLCLTVGWVSGRTS